MSDQRNQHYRAIPYARENFDRLCRKYGTIPTPADVDAIRNMIGPVSVRIAIQHRFEAALLFFLPRSAVQFDEDSLLIGWMYENDGQTKREVWYRTSTVGRSPLCHVPGGVLTMLYSPKGSPCDEWHPVIFDIVDPDENKNRLVQYAYFKACIKLLQAAVPPPSTEYSLSAPVDLASTNPATLGLNGLHQEPIMTPQATPAPEGRQKSSTVDLTGSEEEVVIKPELASTSTPISHPQVPPTPIEERIQAFRDKLDNKEVKELQQMLSKQLPSWIRELAEDVLQKKMFRELELAENLLL